VWFYTVCGVAVAKDDAGSAINLGLPARITFSSPVLPTVLTGLVDCATASLLVRVFRQNMHDSIIACDIYISIYVRTIIAMSLALLTPKMMAATRGTMKHSSLQQEDVTVIMDIRAAWSISTQSGMAIMPMVWLSLRKMCSTSCSGGLFKMAPYVLDG
jgi:hypothetical protein